VIGGTGLISTPLVWQAVEKGFDVSVFNRGQTPMPLPAAVKTVVGDRRDYPQFVEAVQSLGRFDAVIDMITYVEADATSLIKASQGITDHVIFCSTVDVYDKAGATFPIREDQKLGGLGDYARNKVTCERLLTEAQRAGDFDLTIMRPAHTYHDGGAMIHTFGFGTGFLDRLKKGKAVVVHGDGSSLWCNARGEDVAAGFVAAVGLDAARNRQYTLASDEWIPWNTYHERIARAMDAPEPKLVHIPTDELVKLAPERSGITAINFQFNNVFDLSAAKQDLGYRLTIPFEVGARRTVRHLEENGRIDNSDLDDYDDRVIADWQRRMS